MPMEPRLASQEIGKTCVVSRQIWSNLGTKSRHRRVACSCSCSSLEPRKDKQKQQKARRWCEAKDMSRLCLIQKPSQVTVCLWQSGKNFMLKGSGNNIHSAWCNEWEKLTLVIQASVQTIYQICKWLCVPIYFVMLLILIMGYLNLKDFKVNSCIYLYCRVEFHYQIGLIHFILKFQPSKQLCCGYLWIIWLKSPSITYDTNCLTTDSKNKNWRELPLLIHMVPQYLRVPDRMNHDIIIFTLHDYDVTSYSRIFVDLTILHTRQIGFTPSNFHFCACQAPDPADFIPRARRERWIPTEVHRLENLERLQASYVCVNLICVCFSPTPEVLTCFDCKFLYRNDVSS